MKVLMVGGTGTISYDATCYFLNKGHDVYLLNRGNRNIIQHENLQYIIGDIHSADVEKLLQGYSFDVIIDYIIFNAAQMERRLRLYEGRCKQFIFISSATAYRLTDRVYTEETELGNDIWKYSREKRECEEWLCRHIDVHSFQYTIIRPYITYDNRRIPFPIIKQSSYYTLLQRILNDKPVIICGSGDNQLTLTSTKDFVVALEGLLLNPLAMNEAFHITGECVTTWNEIFQIICSLLKKQGNAVYIPTAELAEYYPEGRDELLYDKSRNHVFDNSKIKTAVPQFKTTVSVEEGLALTVENLLQNPSNIDPVWNATIDAIIERHELKTGQLVHKASAKSKILYFVYQISGNRLLKRGFNLLRKLKIIR